eukprot:1207245-Amphidinium_carterae.1
MVSRLNTRLSSLKGAVDLCVTVCISPEDLAQKEVSPRTFGSDINCHLLRLRLRDPFHRIDNCLRFAQLAAPQIGSSFEDELVVGELAIRVGSGLAHRLLHDRATRSNLVISKSSSHTDQSCMGKNARTSWMNQLVLHLLSSCRIVWLIASIADGQGMR